MSQTAQLTRSSFRWCVSGRRSPLSSGLVRDSAYHGIDRCSSQRYLGLTAKAIAVPLPADALVMSDRLSVQSSSENPDRLRPRFGQVSTCLVEVVVIDIICPQKAARLSTQTMDESSQYRESHRQCQGILLRIKKIQPRKGEF